MSFQDRRKRPVIALAVSAGLVVAGLVGSAQAVADQPQDDQYFAALQQIYPGRSLREDVNVENAHKVCDRLGHGDTADAVANELHGVYPQHRLDQVQQEVHLAQSTYCP